MAATPCLAALYPAPPTYGTCAAIDAILIICPSPDAMSLSNNALVTRSVPSTLVSYIHCQSSRSASATESSPLAPPALFTSRSQCGTRLAKPTTESSRVTSSSMASALPPVALIASTSSSSRSARRAAATACHPSAASATAVALPIPLDAPVTTAIFLVMAFNLPVEGAVRNPSRGRRQARLPA